MKNFKKTLALVLAFVLTIVATVGATVAWMTAEVDEKKNVFTVGEIGISLDEVTEVVGEGGTVHKTQNGAEYVGVMPGDYLKKEVTVANTGNKPAYVATTVTVNNALAINKAIEQYYEAQGYTEEQIQAIYDEVFEGWGLNYGKDLDGDGSNDAGMRLTITGDDMPDGALQVDSVKTIDEYALFYTGNWFGEQEDVIPFDGFYAGGNEDLGIPAMEKYQLRYTYFVHLDPEEEFVPFTGLNAPAYFDNEQMKMFQGLEITVDAAAIQADNFDTAKDAFEALYGIDGHYGSKTVVSDADELVEALENGEDVILEENVKISPANMSNAYGTTGINVKNGQTIDGNGNTLDIKGAGGTWDSGINTTGGVVKNITITGSFRGIFVNHNSSHSEPVILENVTITGTTYTISCDQGLYQTLTATNSTFNGWTSYAATLGKVKFIDCEFGYGSGYKFCRPYAPTTFVGCNFCEGYTLDPRAAVTLENCTLNGVALTDANIADLVTSTANVTVK